MITFMYKTVCVTNRHLCKENYLEKIEKIAKTKPEFIVLREKDLSEEEYEKLAVEVIKICKDNDCICVLHNFVNVAKKLNHRYIHLPLGILSDLSEEERKWFIMLGSSCHSLEDAKKAYNMGCTYIFAGHIFETDCKAGICGRGLDFLKEICDNVFIPVIAIGGINKENAMLAIKAGAYGVAKMSYFMK